MVLHILRVIQIPVLFLKFNKKISTKFNFEKEIAFNRIFCLIDLSSDTKSIVRSIKNSSGSRVDFDNKRMI